MVKVIHLDEDGTETSAIELDDFTVEILYAGIATMLAEAETASASPPLPARLSRQASERRARIIERIRS